ncbi:MAG: beta-galactosidase [Armatimonadetes bacterium]|nr:beta-galactosidase [Armatimonadota bacterium]
MKLTPVRVVTCILLVCIAFSAASAARINLKDPIRLADDQTLKAVYYFPHWWDPWKSDDAVVTADLKKMKEIGFNTVCLDHEVSQAVDRDFFWLDREYKLAGQEKMCVLPWLQLQAVDRSALMQFSHLTLKPAVNQDKQLEEDCIIYGDPEFKKALIHYVSVYLDRYAEDPALLRIKDGKKLRPVVGLMLETGWRSTNGLPLSFDETTNAYFRKWMKALYYDIKHLNKKWGTSFKDFDEIDPCDKAIFNYAFTDRANPPMAVSEHVIFRARVIKECLQDVAREIRKKHKDILFVAEVAYPFESSDPNAEVYHYNNANDAIAVDFADIVFVRTLGGPVVKPVVNDGGLLKTETKRVILAYRLFDNAEAPAAVNLALDCAINSNGFAYYNWNEKADQTSAIFDKPERQTLVKIMTGAYDVFSGFERTREAVPVVPAIQTPAPVPPVPVQPVSETAPVTAPAPVQEAAPPAPAPVPVTAPATPAPDQGVTPPAPVEPPIPAEPAK